MTWIIDIVLLVIIALCTWGGYKRGIVAGIAGLLAIVVALFGGSLLSATYAGEVVPALKPFVGGIIDTPATEAELLEKLGYGDSDKSLRDILAEDPSLSYDYAYCCMQFVGFSADRATELANRAAAAYERNRDDGMPTAVVDTLCDAITYVAGLVLAFAMILIILVSLANLGNLSFRLPNMENLDEIGGAVLGFVRGFIYCVLLCWALSFLGAILGQETVEGNSLVRFFLSFDFITSGLM